MTRLFKNWKSLYKGVLFALAFIMAFTFVPMNAIELLAQAAGESADKEYNTITLSADAKNTVTMGGTYSVKYATFKAKGDSTTKKIGEAQNSSIKVVYKGTKDEEDIDKANNNGEVYGEFKPSRVGTYTLIYSITEGTKTYTYNHDITCTIAKSSFNFYDLRKNGDTYEMNGNLPNVYDLNYLSTLKDHNRDVTLPLPTILDEKGKEFENVTYTTDEAEAQHGNAMLITLSTPTNDAEAKIEKDGDNFVIKAASLKAEGNYTITYTFKQDNHYVDSTQKTFEVKNGYFYKDSENKSSENAGYTLETEWATSAPTTAVTNVKTLLPKVTGRTSSSSSPSKEIVPVNYTIKVQHRNATTKNWEDVEGDYIVVEDDNYYFQPQQDGDYLITYSVFDYYHTDKPVDTNRTYIEIKDVKDTQLPTVYLYNADPTYHEEGSSEYKDASSRLKSVTSHDNIILYAIGGEDNSADDLELTRSILDSGSVERFSTVNYTDKNLIIEFTGLIDLLGQNYALSHDIAEDTSLSLNIVDGKYQDAEKIKQWLIDHNYLIVTNSLETVPDDGDDSAKGRKTFVYSGDALTDEQKIAELEKAGYAYVNYGEYLFTNAYGSSDDDTAQDDRTSTYTVRYEARDKYAKDNNTQKRTSYTMKLASTIYSDNVAPSITGPQNLYTTYLDTDVIKFTAPSATDSSDTNERLDVITAYRFLKNDGSAIERKDTDDQTIEFTPGDSVNGEKPVRNESKGWYFVEPEDDQISIDLNTKPTEATRVQILIYAIDDYGNIGQWKKTMEITNTGDDDQPTIVSIAKGNLDKEKIQQGDKITLPTIQYTDKHVGFMSAQVIIENTQTIKIDDEKTETVHHTLSNQNMNASPYPYMNLYTVDAGSFVASYSGDYMVTIVVRDGGGHSIATYFEYSVEPVIRVEDVKIDNIYETNINRRVTAPFEVSQNEDGIYRLTTPTLNLPTVDGYTFAGVGELDDANTALDYYINVISAGGRYNLTSTYFQGLDAETYKFQYMVKLISVQTGEKANNSVSIDETTGRVKINKDGTDYYVYVDDNGDLHANKELYGNATNNSTGELTLSESSIEDTYGLKGYIRPSDVITLTYSSADAPIVTIDPGKIAPQYAETGTEIVLPRISASTASGELDQEKSRVVIQVAKSGGTSTLQTIKMCDWETSTFYKPDQGKQLVYKLEYNGTYTITYYAVEKGSSAEGKKVITIKNGDTISPELNLNTQKGFITDKAGNIKKSDEFKLNDVLLLHKDKVTASDLGGSTTNEEIATKIEIAVRFGGKDVDPTQDGDTYSYNLDTAGDYIVMVTVTDNAGWRTQDTVTISVQPEGSEATITYETIGIILIVISAVILAGVVGYFIYSKVKLDKETKKIKK